MDNSNDSSGCFQSLMIYIVVFLLLPILFVQVFIDSSLIPKMLNLEPTGQQQEIRRETPKPFYCNTCNKHVGGHRISEWESGNGHGFYIVTEILDCGHRQDGH